jgi:hypothetical protein
VDVPAGRVDEIDRLVLESEVLGRRVVLGHEAQLESRSATATATAGDGAAAASEGGSEHDEDDGTANGDHDDEVSHRTIAVTMTSKGRVGFHRSAEHAGRLTAPVLGLLLHG